LAGTPESVSNMGQTALRAFHKLYYSPNNVVVSVCGNFSHEAVVEYLEEKLGNFHGQEKDAFLPYKSGQKKPRVHFFKKDTEQVHLALGFPSLKVDHPDMFALSVLNIILGGNMSSRLFDELREKRGLAYSVYSAAKAYDDTGLFMVKAGVDGKKVEEALELIIKILRQIRRGTVKEQEFVRSREYFLGQFVLGLEDTMEHMIWIGESMIERNRLRTIGEVVYRVNGLTPDDIRRVANDVLKDKRMNLAVVGTIAEKQEQAMSAMVSAEA
jgi:predicted Zn-dependent peptidase